MNDMIMKYLMGKHPISLTMGIRTMVRRNDSWYVFENMEEFDTKSISDQDFETAIDYLISGWDEKN